MNLKLPSLNLLKWLPIFLWAVVISYLSFSSLEQIPLPSFFGWDKLGHFSMYFVLEFLFLIPLRHRVNKLFFWSVIAVLFSGFTELVQNYFIENRYGEWMDFLANSLGILIAYHIVYRKLKN